MANRYQIATGNLPKPGDPPELTQPVRTEDPQTIMEALTKLSEYERWANQQAELEMGVEARESQIRQSYDQELERYRRATELRRREFEMAQQMRSMNQQRQLFEAERNLQQSADQAGISRYSDRYDQMRAQLERQARNEIQAAIREHGGYNARMDVARMQELHRRGLDYLDS